MTLFPEDIPPNRVILKIGARDADIGTNGEIHYSLYGSGNSKFFLDSESGKITRIFMLAQWNSWRGARH